MTTEKTINAILDIIYDHCADCPNTDPETNCLPSNCPISELMQLAEYHKDEIAGN